jgi:RNA polymerase sigma factor (sigma-70 family)
MSKEISAGSVTRWLNELRAGDNANAQRLWAEYCARLVRLARAKLDRRPRTLDDADDIAAKAFKSFCSAARRGQFSRLDDRHDLWQILVMLADRKARDAMRRARARPPGVPWPDRDVAAPHPTPRQASELADQVQHLLEQLQKDDLRAIALDKVAGFTNEEIGARMSCSRATVERKLALIRRIWREAASDD